MRLMYNKKKFVASRIKNRYLRKAILIVTKNSNCYK